MRPIVELFTQHKGGKKAFCEAHGLTISCLDYWRRKLANPSSETPAFIPLEVDSSEVYQQIEVCYPNGVRVFLPLSCPEELLQRVLNYS